jgi:predicted nucleic acid-binding protein
LKTLTLVYRVLEGEPGVAAAWENLVARHSVSGKKAHDAHLVAVMQVYGVTDILTFNVADFRRYPGVRVLDPMQI